MKYTMYTNKINQYVNEIIQYVGVHKVHNIPK